MYWKSIEDRGWRTKLKNTSPYIIINIHWLLLSFKSLKALWNGFSCKFVHSLTWHEIVCDFVHVSMGKMCCCPGLNTLYTIKTLTHHTLHSSITLYECGLWYIGLPGSSFFDTSTEQALVDLFWTHSLEKIQVLVLNSYNIDLTKLNATIKYWTHTMSFCTKTTDLFHKIILLCCFLSNWWKLFWCGLNLSGIYCDLSGAGYELRV